VAKGRDLDTPDLTEDLQDVLRACRVELVKYLNGRKIFLKEITETS
jgi:hypothetical protein